MLQFKNPDVAEKYQSPFKGDPIIHHPGRKATGFRCRLSEISMAQAEKLYSVRNQNLLQLRTPVATPAAGEEKVAKKKQEDKPAAQ